MDEVSRNPASIDPAGARRHGPDDPEPTGAAELYIVLLPGNRPDSRADVPDPGPPGSAEPSGALPLRPFGPAVQVGVKRERNT